MALSEKKIRGYIQRLLLSRMRILCNHGFYGLLLMHMRYGVDEKEETAYTDGERIVFGTDFLDNLSDSELDPLSNLGGLLQLPGPPGKLNLSSRHTSLTGCLCSHSSICSKK